ncbi:hypothetical protein HPP92_010546 [Vanilla planifolia]|uniref:Uncharacterized protein n=1 Tax=Vanilla planifolia TaxID=51239 RepID=A0A835R4E5_VANPL|nr:hypothetical protein HPP92_010785 [Vanilla planifolia]KAG0482462.1 hypothetical protein HPP92_010546 [Vanilla planifolia]
MTEELTEQREVREQGDMSPLLSSMDAAQGPTVGAKEQQVSLPVFLLGDQMENVSGIIPETKAEDLPSAGDRALDAFSFSTNKLDQEDDDPESSSIGTESSSEEEEDVERGEEGQSTLKEEGSSLASLDSLEDSLPIKRGLSNFFVGKSKSFASLSDAAACTARDLAKPENPFNKRRRILIANKASRSRRASYSSLIVSLTPLFSPDLAVNEGEGDEGSEGEEDSPLAPLPKPHSSHNGAIRFSKAFKSPRSFSLSDLQNV